MKQNNFEKKLGEIKKLFLKHYPDGDATLIEEAFYYTQKAHENQFRHSGEPFFTHPIEVARLIAEKGMDESMIAAALLHDVVEDTQSTKKEIRKLFGKQVEEIVEGLTKLSYLSFRSKQEHSTATTIKTIIAGSKDIRILIIKLFDKLHNMRTLKFLPKEKQKRIAADVLTIYVPILHKLGMHELKFELEDLAFKAIDPKEYGKLKKMLEQEKKQKRKEIKKTIEVLRKKFPKTEWRFEEESKSVYYTNTKKMLQKENFDKRKRSVILKVIVPAKHDCYTALGKIHEALTPIPGKIKDYISMPEYGIYRALHTQVLSPEKKPLKVYIASEEMDEIGEDGIVVFVKKYGADSKKVRQITEMLSKADGKEATSQKELAGSMQLDFHDQNMVVFTTTGEIVNVPQNSTALDFAVLKYEAKAAKAKEVEINKKIMPLWTCLNSGDQVRIIFSDSNNINSKWFSYANSYQAKRIIEKNIGKKHANQSKTKTAKIRIDSVDRIGILRDQTKIMAKNKVNLQTTVCKMYDDKATCFTELYITVDNLANLQKAVDELKRIKETLNVTVKY